MLQITEGLKPSQGQGLFNYRKNCKPCSFWSPSYPHLRPPVVEGIQKECRFQGWKISRIWIERCVRGMHEPQKFLRCLLALQYFSTDLALLRVDHGPLLPFTMVCWTWAKLRPIWEASDKLNLSKEKYTILGPFWGPKLASFWKVAMHLRVCVLRLWQGETIRGPQNGPNLAQVQHAIMMPSVGPWPALKDAKTQIQGPKARQHGERASAL